MVQWSDLFLVSPWNSYWHFLVGMAVVLIAVRLRGTWGMLLLVGFVLFIPFKEYGLDLWLEGQTFVPSTIDLIWFYIGGVVGAVVGVLPVKFAALVAGVVLTVVGVLLVTGVV